MSQISRIARVILKPDRDGSLLRGHPWVFSGAIKRLDGDIAPGELVDVYSAGGEFLGCGHYGGESIAVRLLSRQQISSPGRFLFSAFSKALDVRRSLGLVSSAETTAYRLVNAEGDGLSGLVVDMYNKVAVIQCHSPGMLNWRAEIVKALADLLGSSLDGVFDKSPLQEGRTSLAHSVLTKTASDSVIRENGLFFDADWRGGQKTGLFLDQRENRNLFRRHVAGRSVLNAFCYTGAFSIYALSGGASSVVSVDSSARALEGLERNLELNAGMGRHESVCADCLEYLKSIPENFSVIVLDPPAFVKHQGALRGGIKGYESINYQVLRQIPSGGLLWTFSCSQFVTAEIFRKLVSSCVVRAERSAKILYELRQAPCHPVCSGHPEGEYLKGLCLYVS